MLNRDNTVLVKVNSRLDHFLWVYYGFIKINNVLNQQAEHAKAYGKGKSSFCNSLKAELNEEKEKEKEKTKEKEEKAEEEKEKDETSPKPKVKKEIAGANPAKVKHGHF